MKALSSVIFILSVWIILGGCSYQLKEVDPPENLIPRDSFQLVLLDMMLLEGFVKTKHSNVHDFHQIMLKSALPIFDKYGLDSAQYANSMDYYSHHQEILKEMYQAVQDSITLWSVNKLIAPGDSLVIQ